MTTVIVPLDGSIRAESALPHAQVVAGPHGRLVLVVAAWNGEPLAPRRYLEDRALGLVGGAVDTRVLCDERPSLGILRVAAGYPDGVVCMATHGRNALGQAVLGSTAEAVVRASDRPVLLVGPKAMYDPRRAAAHNLVVAVDDPETADRLSPVAVSMADRHHLHPWVLQAVAPAPYPFVADADVPATLGRTAGLDHMSAALLASEHPAEAKVLVATDPAVAVTRFARDLPASYVLMGTHGRSGVGRVALGSTAMRVVHGCPCPVMVVRS
jgi:nucleotide-binding universal stress UspA family protein